MTPRRARLLRGGGGRLIGPGFLSPLFTLTRAQAGGAGSTALGADGVTWQEFGPDAPRFSGGARRLVAEGQTTNAAQNPRAEGVVSGAPGTSPPFWSLNPPSGFTREMLSTVVENGRAVCRVRFFGSRPTAGTMLLFVADAIPALTGQTWVSSCALAISVASGPTPAVLWSNREVDSGNTVTAVNPTGPLALSASLADFNFRTVLNGGANTASLLPGVRVDVLANTTYDFTLLFALPHVEQSAIATTPVLPAIGAPAASTRGADVVSAPYSALFPGGVGTIVAECLLPFGGLAGGADRLIVELSDGTANNRIRLRANPQATALTAGRVIGGVSADAPSLGTIAPGVPFRVAITWDGSEIRAGLNGPPEQVVAGLPSGLNTVRVGNTVSNFGPLNGEIGTFRVIPAATPAGGLPALLNAL